MIHLKKLSTREMILQAAHDLVRQQGVNRLTLEAVAKQASISKGGLLYHFPTKEALIKAMVEHLFTEFDQQLTITKKQEAHSPGMWSQNYVQNTFLMQNKEENELSVGLLAALANNPELLEPARDYYQKWQKHFENDQIDPVLATIVRLATDGLWFADLFGLAPLDQDLREQVCTALQQLVKEKRS